MHCCLRILFTSLLLVLFSKLAFSQAQDKKLAQEYFDQAEDVLKETKAIDQARDLFVIAADTDTTNLKANFEAGYTYIQTVNKELATKFFLRVYRQNPTYRFEIEYRIGQGYQFGQQFDRAVKYYKLYQNKVTKSTAGISQGIPSAAEVEKRITECNNGKEFIANPKKYSIVHMGDGINSEFDDYGPVINEDEDEMIFTTRRREGNTNEDVFDDNLPYEDIFITKKVGKKWSKAENIGPTVNRKTNESSIGLSADGKKLLIYHDEGNGDIYECELQKDGTWGKPEPLPDVINSTYKETSVSLSKDGNTLYFASNRPGGLGGLDIYVCTKDSRGDWSRVKNMGPSINTTEDDESPFIDYEGTTLYFSTKARRGMGGYDIYKSLFDKEKNEWAEPVNLGYPINTPDDDLFYVATKDGQRAYYSSVREDGLGYQDIYMITVAEEKSEPTLQPTPTVDNSKADSLATAEAARQKAAQKSITAQKSVTIPIPSAEQPKTEPINYTVRVIDASTQSPLDVKIKMQGFKDNVMVGVSSSDIGTYEFSITSTKPKQYRLYVEKEGYIFVNEALTIEGAGTVAKKLTKTISLRKLVVGASSVLKNIYFDFDKAQLKSESTTELNKLESLLRQNNNMMIEIGGHTDYVGSREVNMRLSQLRANAVRSFLVNKGIDPRRVQAKGYGKDKPLASNDDEKEGRELNRRVEFKILTN
jgi:outer membrane protein OmpA-like peptidoglycan-associated protein